MQKSQAKGAVGEHHANHYRRNSQGSLRESTTNFAIRFQMFFSNSQLSNRKLCEQDNVKNKALFAEVRITGVAC